MQDELGSEGERAFRTTQRYRRTPVLAACFFGGVRTGNVLILRHNRCLADAASLIRCSPGEDATNGFFVSCFVRGEAAVELSNSVVALGKRKADNEGQGEGVKKKKKKKKKKVAKDDP